MTNKTTKKQLFRSESNRMLAGVAGGLGEYFNIDPTLVRLAFILLAVWGGSGVLIYILMWIFIPSESSNRSVASEETVKENTKEVEMKAKHFAKEAEVVANRTDTQVWIGAVLTVLGIWFLLVNFGILGAWLIGKLWPLILILIGITMLIRHNQEEE